MLDTGLKFDAVPSRPTYLEEKNYVLEAKLDSGKQCCPVNWNRDQ